MGRGENIFKGAGEGFQQCYALKPLKNEGKGRKKMHRVGNDDLLF